MAQMQILPPSMGIGHVPTSLTEKEAFVEQIIKIGVSSENAPIFVEDESCNYDCDELVRRALQVQNSIENLIDAARERESQRLATLTSAMRELEQNQTVALLLLGMLNRRVLYEYEQLPPSIDDEAFESEGASFLSEELSLLRRTVAGVALSEERCHQLFETRDPHAEASWAEISRIKSAVDAISLQLDNRGSAFADDLALRHVVAQARETILECQDRKKRVEEMEAIQLKRFSYTTEPLWDVCRSVSDMCDVLEFNDFELCKDEFLKKVLVLAGEIPNQWPQAVNFRCEVRSDIRSNLGLPKYGELRWHN